MRVWRISDFADLRGDGGLHASGRWHTRGRRVVYLADHPASALLEVLVHMAVDVDDLPSIYQLLAVDLPDDMAAGATLNRASLPKNWASDVAITRKIGDDWLAARRFALLGVPSAIVPSATNWLLNPDHPDAANARIVDVINAPFDMRLFR